ncbi:sulfur relay protein, TusE/DsrC/DsvC family [Providencia rustigianii DSM 4541]|uniref:Sulfurtransferase TusE n=3 Tax=Morganellaceae TaxID=1903414 RepID=D1NZW7_9GAMM|nr:sulfur relay protein, TusE/DsrC/DsvC family [Providencia rustigianii DSM 4541]
MTVFMRDTWVIAHFLLNLLPTFVWIEISMLVFNNQEIETDPQGYLLDSQQWSEALIPLLAEQEEIEITDEHLEIIRFVRAFYLEFNTSPAIRMLVKAVSQQFGEEKGNSRYLYRLFPKGPAKQATKLAGLPKPVKCI